MDESQFISETAKIIHHIVDTIEQQDHEELIDLDYHNDVLTIEDDRGVFVINKQTPKREIWLSSPISGPHHFRYSQNGQKWINHSGMELFDLLQDEFDIRFKTRI